MLKTIGLILLLVEHNTLYVTYIPADHGKALRDLSKRGYLLIIFEDAGQTLRPKSVFYRQRSVHTDEDVQFMGLMMFGLNASSCYETEGRWPHRRLIIASHPGPNERHSSCGNLYAVYLRD